MYYLASASRAALNSGLLATLFASAGCVGDEGDAGVTNG
jgi:hypothetical protein